MFKENSFAKVNRYIVSVRVIIISMVFFLIMLNMCEDNDKEPSYCSIHGDIVWTLEEGKEDYTIAWTDNDDKANYRMKWSQDEEDLKLPGYWCNATLDNPPGATILRNVTLSPDEADFFIINTTLNDLPAGCK